LILTELPEAFAIAKGTTIELEIDEVLSEVIHERPTLKCPHCDRPLYLFELPPPSGYLLNSF